MMLWTILRPVTKTNDLDVHLSTHREKKQILIRISDIPKADIFEFKFQCDLFFVCNWKQVIILVTSV